MAPASPSLEEPCPASRLSGRTRLTASEEDHWEEDGEEGAFCDETGRDVSPGSATSSIYRYTHGEDKEETFVFLRRAAAIYLEMRHKLPGARLPWQLPSRSGICPRRIYSGR